MKGNQGTLHEDVALYLPRQADQCFDQVSHDYRETIEKGHGRIETRRYWITEEIQWLRERHGGWRDLKRIGVVESCREKGGVKSRERRYYISSKEADAEAFASAVRRHWGIENQLHWVLDVAFNEDQCRVRQGHAAENFATLRKMAINMLKRQSSRLSIKAKRKKTAWDFAFLCQVLQESGF